MSLDQLANIAEIVGMLVIAITLIFLAIQMWQNTAALRSAATREAHAQYAQIYVTLATNDSVRDTFVKGISDPAALSETETSRFFSFWMVCTINYQNWVHQTQSGAMDRELLNSYSKVLQGMGDTPGFKVFWEERKYLFSASTKSHVEAAIQRGAEQPYRPLGVS